MEGAGGDGAVVLAVGKVFAVGRHAPAVGRVAEAGAEEGVGFLAEGGVFGLGVVRRAVARELGAEEPAELALVLGAHAGVVLGHIGGAVAVVARAGVRIAKFPERHLRGAEVGGEE